METGLGSRLGVWARGIYTRGIGGSRLPRQLPWREIRSMSYGKKEQHQLWDSFLEAEVGATVGGGGGTP